MTKLNSLAVFIFILINNFFVFSNLQSQINNDILVKVGEQLITTIDLQNDVITNLVINKQEVNQNNINNTKDYSIKKLINKAIKRIEIKKYEITNYSKQDLKKYIKSVEKNLNTNSQGLKETFKQSGINYEIFVEMHEVELLWNTLIFDIYNQQTNINILEVDRELEKAKVDKDEKDLNEIRKKILNKKQQEKLDLFSRSHFSNLENTIDINFQ